ncbi:MMPL family transporter [Mobilitalea sibirica]|uniref:MMPL family transporter n=1 Tax=Mobilitalea sibirica TaxID=1462919 RepID=A0A8J7KVC6_9FIRM|nr:MMPL family transporter [Mobilitalea sibirica]MBH1940000.1 MMPL family transporter [Mobilitalea sibirica]
MLKRLARIIVNNRIKIMILFGVILGISILLIPMVKVNYNMSKYLPEDMATKRSMLILEQEFGLNGSAQVMVSDVSIPKAKEIKDKIALVEGVKSVTWLDDIVDIRKPLDILEQEVIEEYYRENTALYQVTFDENDHSLRSGAAIDKIREITDQEIAFRGPTVAAKAMRETTSNEIFLIVVFVVPICLLILILATSSWFEPILFLLVIGVSVVINAGTNVIFGEVSFMTQMSSSVLQLAIAMDYSIFLLHRFAEERAEGAAIEDAMRKALYKSFTSISSSSLTTVAGFVALMFMRYKIGMDMGLVLAKGIFLSLISVLLLLPALAILSDKLIEKTHHRSFLPSFQRFGNAVVKMRYFIVGILLIVIIPAFLGQSSNNFLYGEASVALSEGTQAAEEEARIEAMFGRYNPVLLLVPSGEIARESALVTKLNNLDTVKNVQALVTIADTAIAREMLPQKVVEQFETENYSRMILNMNTEVENDEAFKAVDHIKELTRSYYGEDYIMVGSTVSVRDIKSVVDVDYTRVNLISILAVGFILLLTFRSLLLPVILILVIESSIWINMSIPYFMGSNLIFIGYMIVSAVQLGATIDYAILLTDRYLHNRKKLDKKSAVSKAIADSGGSILTSAGILCTAGFIMGRISTISGISELGILIGRGALLSGLLVFILLPQLLLILDNAIHSTTLKETTIKKLFYKNRQEG